MSNLSRMPLAAGPKPWTTPGNNFESIEMLHLVFNEAEREDLDQRIEAVRRRREFRLIQGTKP
jgi:hypothetical protein